MSMEAVKTQPQAVSFGEEGQKKSKAGRVFKSAVTGAVLAGVPTYFFLKDPVNAKYITGLKDDKFEKSKVMAAVKKENETVYNSVTESRDSLKNVAAKADEEVAKVFVKDGAAVEELSVSDYLKNVGETAKTKEELANEITELLKDAEANKAAIDTKQAHKAIIDAAGEGNIQKSAYKGLQETQITKSIVEAIETAAGKLEGKVKYMSASKAFKYGGIAAAVFAFLALVTGNKKSGKTPA